MAAARVKIPAGEKITVSHGKLQVPDHPIVASLGGAGPGAAPCEEAPVRVLGHLGLPVVDRVLLARRILDPRCRHGASPR